MHQRLTIALATALLLAVACKKEAATEAPGDAAGAAERPASDIDDLERELAELEDELASKGAVPRGESAGDPASTDAADKCERTCDLADAICGLKDRICGMVADHEDEPRYGDACTRATDDCDRATEACSGCSQ
ncbi:MAG TPA: hypothetical protein VG755_05075 [Nannocystaceae bacterium]|nr:hypothetical protein [Nannocystaceae bacterium]